MENYNKKHKITLEITDYDLRVLHFVRFTNEVPEMKGGFRPQEKYLGEKMLHEALKTNYREYCMFRVGCNLHNKGKASIEFLSRYNRLGLEYPKIREALERCRHAYGY